MTVTVTLRYTGDPNEERDWIFTFGHGHVHPETNEPLVMRFLRVPGTWLSSRQRVLSLFGQKWSMQYPTEDEAGVAEYHMTELPESEWPKAAQPAEPRELTVDELNVDDMVGNMHFRVGEAWALVGGTRNGTPAERIGRAIELRDKLWSLIPFLKALGRLALEHPGRTRQLWAEALGEPMPFGGAPLGMPKVAVEKEPS